MPVTPTFPGVYIEEIPSGVRTINGVSTSVGAFVDYFRRGLENKPFRVFNFGDFEREFGGLDTLSEASYAIQQFFLNGGTEAWIVRTVGSGAVPAKATLPTLEGASALEMEAGRGTRPNPGKWGNKLRVQVDPVGNKRFNLTVLLVDERAEREVVVTSEEFRNLTVGAEDSPNVTTVLNDENTGSKLVRVVKEVGISPPLATGTISGDLKPFPPITADAPRVNVTIGEETVIARFARPESLADARHFLESAIRQARPQSKAFSEATVTVVENRLRILAGPTSASTKITFAGTTDPTAGKLGLVEPERLQGRMSDDLADVKFPPDSDLKLSGKIGSVSDVEVVLEASSMRDLNAARTELEKKLRAASSAPEFSQSRVVLHTAGAERRFIVLAGTPEASVSITGSGAEMLHLRARASTAVKALVGSLPSALNVTSGSTVAVTIGDDGPHTATFAENADTLQKAAEELQKAIRALKDASAFKDARVAPYEVGGQSRLIAISGPPGDTIMFALAPVDMKTVEELRLTEQKRATVNVQRYAFGGVVTDVLPDGNALKGDRSTKTGLHALEEVDLFNILCIPRATMLGTAPHGLSSEESLAVLSAARDYCERRRAFLLIDTPRNVDAPADFDDPEDITRWLDDNAGLRSRNVALYYPRVRVPDPLDQFRLRSIGASGTVAGLFARTDATRGVWKAPAGTDTVARNVSELGDLLSDQENGTLNPLAINCLRNFPIFGSVVWGARTLEGSDQAASEWKYIPVRRLALFLEESLYRGTKWVVFEPNDEPLWAQIRLNFGAFMQNLFRQGAFQGKSPREAYFVKCDSETTTQDDINRGIVNILVGFAPLKPAEFVIIKFQQIAGQIAT